MHDDPRVEPDSTAVPVALWRALHVLVDPPPHVLLAVIACGACEMTCAGERSNLANMSIPVELERLGEQIARYGPAYLLTVARDGRPHAVSASVEWSEGALLAGLGRRTAENIAERPLVTLLWPPAERGGYTLIVDATALLEGAGEAQHARLVPTRGVLHRPAAEDRASAPDCAADCVPLLR
jgi:hypothetical protein